MILLRVKNPIEMACIQRHSITLRKRDVLIVSSEDLLPEMYVEVCRTPDNPNSILSLERSEAQHYSVLAFNSNTSSFKRLIVLHLTSKWVIWIHMSKKSHFNMLFKLDYISSFTKFV